MNKTIEIREAVRSFLVSNSRWLTKVGKGLIALVSFLIINHYFGYISFLANPIIAIIMAIGCAFIPLRPGGLLVMIYIFVQLTGLSSQVAIVALLLMIGSYGLSIFYGATHMFNVNYIPVALQIRMPYPIVVLSALFGKMNDVVAVISGGILSFYLKVVRENALLFIENPDETSIVDVISKKMLLNPMLYVYVISMVALFVIIMLVRKTNIKHSWLVALSSGIFVEMVFMMLGYIITGNISKVPLLIASNVLAFIVGVIANYIFRDIDYNRIEKVQFEDDDYIYYVTAIPKIGLAREEKRIARITEAGKKHHNIGKIEDDEKSEES